MGDTGAEVEGTAMESGAFDPAVDRKNVVEDADKDVDVHR
jgi:hypothetical protein